jgi:hypothetical protein
MGQALNNLKFMFSTTRMLLFVPLQQHWSFELAWYSIITPNAIILSKRFGFCRFFLTRRGQKFSWVDNQLQQEKFWLAVLLLQCRSKLDNWGLIFIYSYSALLISFEIDCFYGLWTRIYEHESSLDTALCWMALNVRQQVSKLFNIKNDKFDTLHDLPVYRIGNFLY